MENASKALIIAGAILLAIVIISLGLIVVNNTRETVDTSNLNEQEVQSFNAKFSPYEGEITGTRVKTMLQTVIASNQENERFPISVKFKAKGAAAFGSSYSGASDISTNITKNITNTSSFKVTLSAYENKGRVSEISIEEK